MIRGAQSEAFKQENILAERLHGLEKQMERKGDENLYFMDRNLVYSRKYVAESVRDAIGFEYCLASSSGWTKGTYDSDFRGLPILWAEIRESSLIGPERKPLESEVEDRVLLNVSPWKGVVRFGKKGKLAPRYVGLFEILERIGLVAYRLRLHEELNSVHDTFHVSKLKKCLGNANLHMSLNEIKIDKTLRFVEEPVEIMEY
ncbi:hypothetical protein Tco_0961686 [Tanacetum coccineum]